MGMSSPLYIFVMPLGGTEKTEVNDRKLMEAKSTAPVGAIHRCSWLSRSMQWEKAVVISCKEETMTYTYISLHLVTRGVKNHWSCLIVTANCELCKIVYVL